MNKKHFVLAVITAVTAAATGCVHTVDGNSHMGDPISKDRVEGRYERTVSQLVDAARAVIKFNGQLVSDNSVNNSLTARINQTTVWIKVDEIDSAKPVSRVVVQARGSGGTTDLHLKSGFLKKLTNLGVGIAGVSTGQVGGSKISLPVSEGMFDTTNAKGHFKSPGGWQFVKGANSVPITGVEVNTVRGALYGTISGAHMMFATLSPITAGREGFGARIKAGQLTLTQKAATRISNKLGLQGSQRINQRVMSNEFSTTVPSTLTILGQNEATLEGAPAAFK